MGLYHLIIAVSQPLFQLLRLCKLLSQMILNGEKFGNHTGLSKSVKRRDISVAPFLYAYKPRKNSWTTCMNKNALAKGRNECIYELSKGNKSIFEPSKILMQSIPVELLHQLRDKSLRDSDRSLSL